MWIEPVTVWSWTIKLWPTSPAEAAEFIRSERQLWKPVIKEVGLAAQ